METDLNSGATKFGVDNFLSGTGYEESDFTDPGNSVAAIFNFLDPTQSHSKSYDRYYEALEREFNAEQSQKNRDFQEYMSNTAYQRAMSDIKKAGLNPVLAYQQGGSSTPSGSSASSSGYHPSFGSNHTASKLLSFAGKAISIASGYLV